MTAQQKSIPSLPVANTPLANTDAIVCVANGVTSLIPASQVNATLGTPANSISMTVPGGRFWTDGAYLYVSTANNTVKRATLSTF